MAGLQGGMSQFGTGLGKFLADMQNRAQMEQQAQAYQRIVESLMPLPKEQQRALDNRVSPNATQQDRVNRLQNFMQQPSGPAAAPVQNPTAVQPRQPQPQQPMPAPQMQPQRGGDPKQAFIQQMLPYAMEASKRTGVDPRIIVAQGALESAWGAKAPGNNFFGIKSHGVPGGQTFMTTEVIGGQPVKMRDSFRQYADMGSSVAGYADFLKNNSRYRPMMEAQGLDAQLQALGRSGYATDPNYAAKVGSIAKGINLPQMASSPDQALEVAMSAPSARSQQPAPQPQLQPQPQPPAGASGVMQASQAGELDPESGLRFPGAQPQQVASIGGGAATSQPQPQPMPQMQSAPTPAPQAPMPIQPQGSPVSAPGAVDFFANQEALPHTGPDTPVAYPGSQPPPAQPSGGFQNPFTAIANLISRNPQAAASPAVQNVANTMLPPNVAAAVNSLPASERAKVYGGLATEMLKRQITGGGQPEVGLNPIYGVDKDGNPIVMQPSKSGRLVQSQMPEGVRVSRDPIKMDAGDRWVLLDPITRQPIGTIPKGAKLGPDQIPITNEQGQTIAASPVPGSKRAEEVAEAGQKRIDAQAQREQTANLVTSTIDRAVERIKTNPNWTAGAGGSLLSNLPGTDARDVRGLIDTVKANAGFDKLQAMRAASPTGGALGNVSDRETALLQATIGNLDQSQTVGQLLENLTIVRDVYDRIIHKGIPPEQAAQELQQLQSRGSGGGVIRWERGPDGKPRPVRQ